MKPNWGKTNKKTHTERRGLIKSTQHGRDVEIVIKGRLGGFGGSRWGWELTAGNGLAATCMFVHQTEAAALLDAERVGEALLGLER